MDDLKIIKNLVKVRDVWEDDVMLGITIEGIIGFVMLILCVLTIAYNSVVFGSILLLLLTVIYGTVMSKRISQMRKLKRLRNFVKECKKWQKLTIK